MTAFVPYGDMSDKLRLAVATGMHVRITFDPEAAAILADILDEYDARIKEQLEGAVAEFDRLFAEMEGE